MNNISLMIKEWLLTFSNKKSFLSSKRIERFLFTSTSLGIVISTCVYEMKHDKISASEAIILISPLLIAAGYNTAMGNKDKKEEVAVP